MPDRRHKRQSNEYAECVLESFLATEHLITEMVDLTERGAQKEVLLPMIEEIRALRLEVAESATQYFVAIRAELEEMVAKIDRPRPVAVPAIIPDPATLQQEGNASPTAA